MNNSLFFPECFNCTFLFLAAITLPLFPIWFRSSSWMSRFKWREEGGVRHEAVSGCGSAGVRGVSQALPHVPPWTAELLGPFSSTICWGCLAGGYHRAALLSGLPVQCQDVSGSCCPDVAVGHIWLLEELWVCVSHSHPWGAHSSRAAIFPAPAAGHQAVLLHGSWGLTCSVNTGFQVYLTLLWSVVSSTAWYSYRQFWKGSVEDTFSHMMCIEVYAWKVLGDQN